MKKLFLIIIGAVVCLAGYAMISADVQEGRILVFSKTMGWRHDSIEAGQAALIKLGQAHGVQVDTTEDASVFTESTLRNYQAVVFLNTTGDVLDDSQQLQLQRFIQAGGGFVGIHSATDTEYDWPWYGKLVGGYFAGHPNNPNVREGVISVVDAEHSATDHLPNPWTRADEWYDFRSMNPDVHVLLTVDESSYRDEVQADPHPVAWYHEYDGGRAFYTALGHTKESYAEEAFLEHVWGGLEYVLAGGGPDFGAATVAPDENRFIKVVLDFNLKEPMELEMLDDGRILFIERAGAVKIYDPAVGATETIATLDVFTEFEEGLIGVAKDPNYATNHWVYFTYSNPNAPEIRLSRFVLEGDHLDLDSEKILLTVPVQREQCCHVAGSIEFDAQGNLYLAIGDNTNPFASNGFSPTDEQPGRSPWDAQRTSANTNDLRGKILRITPQPDGTYTIPEGNLFPGDSLHRPEIYTMGHRNPFRISIDPATGYLYWGDVGPDAAMDSAERGPRGHDEVNQARAAGNFGWPYFIGDNKPYHDYDFATQMAGAPYDPAAPVNDSPNNTGARELPPAQPAFIWYPYDQSEEFPLVNKGARNAMAGPVFHVDAYEPSAHRFPAYYDGKLFIYDWMRGWIMAVTMGENGDFVRMEPFMPGTTFSNPTDMIFSPEGAMYLLEYGVTWYTQNLDARLIRIEYQAGNRTPVARASASTTVGAAPLTVQFSAEASTDPDADALQYAWTFEEGAGVQSTEAAPSFTYTTPGRYKAQVAVTDAEGETATAEVDILVGNDMPAITLEIDGNRTFYWNDVSFDYRVQVRDAEDGTLGSGIAPEAVTLTSTFVPEGSDLILAAQGHEALMNATPEASGKTLMEGSDCAACHQQDVTSAGPSLLAIAERYHDDAGAVAYLGQKIIAGGSGVWGDQAMPAHPQFTAREAEQMAQYILSLGSEQPTPIEIPLPLEGTFTPANHVDQGGSGRYVFMASYTDRGGPGVGPLTAQDVVLLRHPRVQAEAFDIEGGARILDMEPGTMDNTDLLRIVVGYDGEYFAYEGVDLTGVQALALQLGMQPRRTLGGTLEARLDAPDGPVIGSLDVSGDIEGMVTLDMPLQPTDGWHDVYITFENEDIAANRGIAAIDWIYFRHAAMP